MTDNRPREIPPEVDFDNEDLELFEVDDLSVLDLFELNDYGLD
jgi:hypothetical protein